MLNLKIVTNSANRKLGDTVISTYRPVGQTCPQDCALLGKGGGCYAKGGFTRFSSNRSIGAKSEFDEILTSGKTLVRHHVSGDVFVNDQLDVAYVTALINFHKANPSKVGWLYTHRLQDWIKAGFTANSIPSNLTVIASCDTQEQIDYAVKNGFRYARVTEDRAITKNEKLCPFDAALQTKKIDDIKVNCQSCKACFDSGEKRSIVFLKH